jgi:hypothetical protein
VDGVTLRGRPPAGGHQPRGRPGDAGPSATGTRRTCTLGGPAGPSRRPARCPLHSWSTTRPPGQTSFPCLRRRRLSVRCRFTPVDWLEPVEANKRARKQHKRKEPPRPPIPADSQPSVARQPGQRPLHLPPVLPKPGRRLDPAPRGSRGAPTTPQPGLGGGAAVALVSVDLAWPGAPPPRRRTDRRDVVDDRRQHGHIDHVGGADRCGQRQPAARTGKGALGPRLPGSTEFAPTWSHAWRARWPSPRWRVTSPAGRARRAGPGVRGAVPRTRRPWRPRCGGARRWPVRRSRAPELGGAARGWRCGPRRRARRSRCGRRWCGAAPRRVGAVGWQQRLDELPAAVGDELSARGSWRGSCHTFPKRERNDI